MQHLAAKIMAHAGRLPEGTPLAAKILLHLGSRAGVDQALSQLVERGQLIRASRGVYLRPVESRIGIRAPSVEQAVEALALQRGEVIFHTGQRRPTHSGLQHRCRFVPSILWSCVTRRVGNLPWPIVALARRCALWPGSGRRRPRRRSRP